MAEGEGSCRGSRGVGEALAAAVRAARITTGSLFATELVLLRPGFYHKRGSGLLFTRLMRKK
jgi:hypothetical protein